MEPTKISVIIPCYNESQVIKTTYLEVSTVLKSNFSQYELIFINDGSRDDTLHQLKEIKNNDVNVSVINFSRNFGHQPAVSAGIANCTGDYAIIIDADLQDPPSCIPEMVNAAIQTGSNVVYGVRKVRKGETFFKKITAALFYRLLNYFSDINIPIDTGDFRLIDKKVIKEFKLLKERNKYIRGLITWIGFKQTPYFYERHPRFAGDSHYPFLKMVNFALKGILYFSKKPLMIAVNTGLLCVIFSIIYFVYYLIQKFYYPENLVPGWTSIIGLVVFIGGIQLLSIGIVGTYIGNVFDEVKSRPEYIIEEIY